MVNLKKIISVFVFLCTIGLLGTMQVSANEIPELEYDMMQGGETVFSDDEISLTIREDETNCRMADKTYTVEKKNSSWLMKYSIKVKKNKIQSVSNSVVKVYKGSTSNVSLTKNSTSKASLSMKWKSGILSSNVSLVATIANGKLKVK